MRRRYDLTRSDNRPFTGRFVIEKTEDKGRLKVPTGFPVSSAQITPVESLPSNCRLLVDNKYGLVDGFEVIYDIPDSNVNKIEFTFQAI